MTDTIDLNMEGLIYPYLSKGNNDTQKTRSSLAGDSQATISGDCTDAEWQANPEGLKQHPNKCKINCMDNNQQSNQVQYADLVKSWLEAEVANLDGGEKRTALVEMLQLLYSSPEVSRFVSLWRSAYSDGRY